MIRRIWQRNQESAKAHKPKRVLFSPPWQTRLGLLLMQIVVVLMHAEYLPAGLWILIIATLLWRLQIIRGKWSLPSVWIRLLVVATILGVITAVYQDWYALEPVVVLLVITFITKSLELFTRRDHLFLVLAAFAVLATAFIMTQNILLTLLGLLSLVLITMSWISLYSDETKFFSGRMVKLLGTLMATLIPVVVLMIFFFPRVGSLWSIPALSEKSVTGIGDSMSPGDFSELSRSQEIAFRVSFDNDTPPPPQERYWRGVTFEEFDGRSWSRSQFTPDMKVSTNRAEYEQYFVAPADSERINYSIIMEPTNKDWLYTLATVQSINEPTLHTSSNEVIAHTPVTQVSLFEVSSATKLVNFYISPIISARTKTLPANINPRIREQAQTLFTDAGSPEQYIIDILKWYRQEFIYTLNPPTLGQNSIDEFMFETKRGFCEHYASSFVFMMRVVGIPARVVVGYQGGKWSDSAKFLTVRQSDAHAWAEVFLDDRGWVRVDPTAAIAPERIEQGLEQALANSDLELMEGWLARNYSWAKNLANRWEDWNYQWQFFVLNYNQNDQSALIEKLFSGWKIWQIGIVIITAIILIPALLIGGLWLWRKEWPSRTAKLHRQLYKKLLKHNNGNDIENATFTQLLERSRATFPAQQDLVDNIDEQLIQHLYASKRTSPLPRDAYQTIKTAIQRLKRYSR